MFSSFTLFWAIIASFAIAIAVATSLIALTRLIRNRTKHGQFDPYRLIPSELNVSEPIQNEAKSSVAKSGTFSILGKPDSSNTPTVPNGLVSVIDLADKQLKITSDFRLAVDAMENTKDCIFITGEAGTGKSTLLKHFVATTKKKIVVLAPTGIAAMNVEGQTIHSFFKFPPRPITADDIKVSPIGELCKVLDTIIVDEISMVRADLLDGIDKFLRLNGRDFTKPFGATQMIFFGDLFQLPPIVSTYTEGQYFGQYYKSPYFFDAQVFNETPINVIKLKHVYRQRDQKFVEILNRIRTDRYSEADLLSVNQRYDSKFESSNGDGYITLTATNKLADGKNRRELAKLPTEEHSFVGTVEGNFDPKSYPTELVLRLKVGAQVMFVKNDTERRWVNGTVGFVKELSDNKICIQIPTPPGQPPLIHEVRRVTWEVISYKLNHRNRSIDSNVVGSFTQFPLRLAWAITIHKGQGKTFEKVVIDLGSGAFAHGQAYVALSRCISLDNLVLKQRLRKQDIIVDQKVFGFLDKLTILPEDE